MEAEKRTAAIGTPRWMRILLGVSLAMNLLVLGLISGAFVRIGGLSGLAALREPPRSVGAVIFHELPGEDRRALWKRSMGSPMQHHMRQMAEAMALSEAVRATPFDREAVAELLEKQAVQRESFQKSVQQAWLDRVAGMTEAERQAYARRLEHAMNRPRVRERRASRMGGNP